jgi:hypothetical protein
MARQREMVVSLYEWFDVAMTWEHRHDGEHGTELCVHAPDETAAVIMALLAMDRYEHGRLLRINVTGRHETFSGETCGLGLISNR